MAAAGGGRKEGRKERERERERERYRYLHRFAALVLSKPELARGRARESKKREPAAHGSSYCNYAGGRPGRLFRGPRSVWEDSSFLCLISIVFNILVCDRCKLYIYFRNLP